MSACFSTIQAFSNTSAASWISFNTGVGVGPVQIILLNGTLLVQGMPGYNASYNGIIFGKNNSNGTNTGSIINLSTIPISSSVICVGGGGAGGQSKQSLNGGGGGGAQVLFSTGYNLPAGNTLVSVASGASYINGNNTTDVSSTLATTINNGATIVTAYSGRAGGFNNNKHSGSTSPANSGAGGGASSRQAPNYTQSLIMSSTGFYQSGGTIVDMVCSDDGKIVIVKQYNNDTPPFISTNYGTSFIKNYNILTPATNYAICVSGNGTYVYYLSNITTFKASTNFGLSSYLTTTINTVSVPQIACSSSGQYIIIVANQSTISYSINYGSSFQTTSIADTVITGMNANQKRLYYVPLSVATFLISVKPTIVYFYDLQTMSYSSIPALTNVITEIFCNSTKTYITYRAASTIYVSTNSGVSFFSNTTISTGVQNNLVMDWTGQFIVATTSIGPPSGSTANYLIYSLNYGVSWTKTPNTISAFGYSGICVTSTGNVIIGYIEVGGVTTIATSYLYIYNLTLENVVYQGIAGNTGYKGGDGTKNNLTVSSSAYGLVSTVTNVLLNSETLNGIYSQDSKIVILPKWGAGCFISTNYSNTFFLNTVMCNKINGGLAATACIYSINNTYFLGYLNTPVSNTSNFCVSSNFGSSVYTTTTQTFPTATSVQVACSYDGSYIVIITQSSSNVYYSTNYGVSFPLTNIDNVTNTAVLNYTFRIQFVPNSVSRFAIVLSLTNMRIFDFKTLTTITNVTMPSNITLGVYCDQTTKYMIYQGTSVSPAVAYVSSNYGTSFFTSTLFSTASTVQQTVAISTTGKYMIFAQGNGASGTQKMLVSSTYGNTWTTFTTAYNIWKMAVVRISYDESTIYYIPDMYSLGTNAYFYAIPSSLALLTGVGGGGGGMGSAGSSSGSGTGGSGTTIAITGLSYGSGGSGATSYITSVSYIAPGYGGGGDGGTYTSTSGGTGGSGQVAVYFQTAYTMTYSSSNPPNQSWDSINSVYLGGPTNTGTSILSFIGTNVTLSTGTIISFTYGATGYTSPLTYQNGYYTVTASSVNGNNNISNLFSTSVSTVFSPNSIYVNYSTFNFNNAGYSTYDQVTQSWIAGEWFQAQIPYSIILTNYLFYTASNASPSAISLLGSNDGTLFYTLNTQIGLSAATAISVSSINTGTVNNAYFSIYRWIITAGSSTSIATQIYNIQLTN